MHRTTFPRPLLFLKRIFGVLLLEVYQDTLLRRLVQRHTSRLISIGYIKISMDCVKTSDSPVCILICEIYVICLLSASTFKLLVGAKIWYYICVTNYNDTKLKPGINMSLEVHICEFTFIPYRILM